MTYPENKDATRHRSEIAGLVRDAIAERRS